MADFNQSFLQKMFYFLLNPSLSYLHYQRINLLNLTMIKIMGEEIKIYLIIIMTIDF